MTPAHPAVPDLYLAAKKAAQRMLLMSVAAVGIGLAAGLVLAVTGVLWICGCLGVAAGLIGIPMSLLRLIDPTGAGTLRRLGISKDARVAALKQVETELAAPGTWHRPTKDGAFFVTPQWFVVVNPSQVVVCATRDLLWLWAVRSRSQLKLKFRSSHGTETIESKGITDELLSELTRALPPVLVGYQPQYQSMSPQAMVQAVTQLRAST